jgi:hypothetical protein
VSRGRVHIFKDIVNGYLALHFDKAHRPTFFSIAKVYPELDAVTKAYLAIRKEFKQMMAEGLSLPEYHEADSGEGAISNTTPNSPERVPARMCRLQSRTEPSRLSEDL